MRLRTGLVIGAVVGYYFGAKAGRRRYVQMSRAIRKVRESEPLDIAAGRVRAVIDLTRERARDVREDSGVEGEYEIYDVTTTLN